MSKLTEAQKITVTQADREIAAQVYAIYFPWADFSPTSTCAKIRRGSYDMLGLVQAFAKHRTDASGRLALEDKP